MKRIQGANATEDGQFQAGDAQTNQPATSLTPTWCNAVQAEIINVIEAAGLVPSNAVDQLLQAMNLLFVRGQTLQVVSKEDNTEVHFTGSFPRDNTVPEITEGTEYPQIATTITPKRANSKLKITLNLGALDMGGGGNGALALFRDNDQYAFRTATVGSWLWSTNFSFVCFVDAISTDPQTIRLRFGGGGWINRDRFGNSVYAGTNLSLMLIEEIAQ